MPPPSPSNPHGHGLAAATSVNRAGNSTDAAAARDHHPAVLERLAQTLDGVAAELGELVQEQHAVVRERSRMYLEAAGQSAVAVAYCGRPVGR